MDIDEICVMFSVCSDFKIVNVDDNFDNVDDDDGVFFNLEFLK